MKRFIWFCSLLMTMHIHISVALAETPDNLKGTWIIDATATEESVIRSPPIKDASSFTSQIRFFGALIFEFDGEKLFSGTFPGNERKLESLLISNHGAERKHISKNQGVKIDHFTGKKIQEEPVTITVTVLSDRNITIAMPGSPAMQYVLWKRVKLDPSKKSPNDFKPEFEAFFAMLLNIEQAFDPTLKSVPRPALKFDPTPKPALKTDVVR